VSSRQLGPGERPWIAFLAAGVVFTFTHEAIDSTLARDVVYLLVVTCTPVAIVIGVRIHRPTLVLPWYLMAAGQLLWVLGDAVYTWLEDVEQVAPFPSAADVLYLAAYPMNTLGILLLLRGRSAHRDPAGLLDSAIVTAGLGLLSWVMLAKPTIAWAREDSLLVASVAVAYPLADILLVAVLMLLVTSPSGRSRSLRLLLVAIAVQVVADSLFLVLDLSGIGAGVAFNWLWMLSYVLWGASALHPSMAAFSRPSPHAEQMHFRRTRMVAMTVAALVAPGILGVQQLLGTELDVTAVVIASALIVALVLARMRFAIGQIASAKAELEKLQQELAHAAAHDALTGLPNRSRLQQQLAAALARAQRRGDLVACLFLDLDGFKAVNDNHGHPAGDHVLRVVAERLLGELRAGDTAARLGGDEFVVVLDPVADEAAAVAVAHRIVAAISRAIVLPDGEEATVGASVGVAFNHDSGTDDEALMGEADTAVYRAKAAGRGRVEVSSPSLGHELARTADLEAALAHAIDHDELQVHHQPIVDLRSGVALGHEALVRWDRPGVGLLPPAAFLPTAERSDLVCDLDAWVLRWALQDLAGRLSEDPSGDLVATVNLSGRHVNAGRAVGDVRAALQATDVDPRRLVVELTETVGIQDLAVVGQLHELRELGVRIALDDFGTGYSSFAQLTRLPLDWIKIDRSYLAGSVPAARPLLELMVEAAHVAGLFVVVEGVEQPDQLDLLRRIGVDAAQGFLLGRPVPETGRSRPITVRARRNLSAI